MRQIALLLTLLVVLTGCTTLTSDQTRKLAVQYATIRVIDQSANIDTEGVIETTRKLRSTIRASDEIDLRGLVRQVDTSGLSPHDQLLVSVLSEQILFALRDYGGELDLPVLERALTVMGWVDEAALMAGGVD